MSQCPKRLEAVQFRAVSHCLSPATVAAAICFVLFSSVPTATASAVEEGVALAIIYDTSGSMKEPVADATGGLEPKYVIANRALRSVVAQLQAFATNSNSGVERKVNAGLFVFQGDHGRQAVRMGPLDAAAFNGFAERFSRPEGYTPLGNTLAAAARAVLDSPLSRKHVLVITDGLNTAGPTPETVLPRLKQQAERQHCGINFHFVAFDVDARQFAPLKRRGATVVGASNERQLNSQIQLILQQKILLEDEEAPKTQ